MVALRPQTREDARAARGMLGLVRNTNNRPSVARAVMRDRGGGRFHVSWAGSGGRVALGLERRVGVCRVKREGKSTGLWQAGRRPGQNRAAEGLRDWEPVNFHLRGEIRWKNAPWPGRPVPRGHWGVKSWAWGPFGWKTRLGQGALPRLPTSVCCQPFERGPLPWPCRTLLRLQTQSLPWWCRRGNWGPERAGLVRSHTQPRAAAMSGDITHTGIRRRNEGSARKGMEVRGKKNTGPYVSGI